MSASLSVRNSVGMRLRNGRGFTLFEFAVTMAIMAVLATVLLTRLSFYAEKARQLAFEQTLQALRTQVQLQAYDLIIANKPQDIASLAGQNPVNWLAQKPVNYLGEFYSPETKKLASDNWFFDRSNGKLVYLLNESNTFGLGASELLQFKVSLKQGAPTLTGSVSGLSLEAVRDQERGNIAVK